MEKLMSSTRIFFRTWTEASLAHLKKTTKPNPGAVTRRDQSNQGKKY